MKVFLSLFAGTLLDRLLAELDLLLARSDSSSPPVNQISEELINQFHKISLLSNVILRYIWFDLLNVAHSSMG